MTLVLAFGAGGQVGRELMQAAMPPGWCLIGLQRSQADIAVAAEVEAAIAAHSPAVVVNAAAYTAVDRAESESARAWAANARGAENLATACAARDVPLIHVSTDYVFDGAKRGAYLEDDPIGPAGVYAASKAAGELLVRALLPRHVILRTSWVFSPFGGNFVKTMLRLGAERPELGVVDDQHGGPSAAADIAGAIIRIARAIVERGTEAPYGTYHYAGAPPTTWFGFAEAIFAAGARRGHRRPKLRPIATAEYPTPARRPANSMLDCTRIGRAFGIDQPDWRVSLDRTLDALIGAPAALQAERTT